MMMVVITVIMMVVMMMMCTKGCAMPEDVVCRGTSPSLCGDCYVVTGMW